MKSLLKSRRASKLSILFIIAGTTLLLPAEAQGAQAINVQVTCATAQGDQRTFTIGWDNTNAFFNGKGQISRLYCEGGYAGNYRTFISNNLSDNTLDYFQGLLPVPVSLPAPETSSTLSDTSTATQESVTAPAQSQPAQPDTPTATVQDSPTVQDSQTATQVKTPTVSAETPTAIVPTETATVDSPPSNGSDSQTAQIVPPLSDSSTVSAPVEPSLPVQDSSTTISQPAPVTQEPALPAPVAPAPSEIVPTSPTPAPSVVEPTPVPVVPVVPAPQPEPDPAPEPAQPEPAPEPEPIVDPQPVEPTDPKSPAPEPVVDPVTEPEPVVEPVVEPAPQSTSLEEELQTPAPEPVNTQQNPLTDSAAPITTEVASPAPVSIVDVNVETLPPETPVELENGVILTAEVVVALQLLENPAQLLGAIFSDPGQALMALGNIGADMSPEVREKSEKVVISAIIAGGIATQAAAIAGASTYRRNP